MSNIVNALLEDLDQVRSWADLCDRWGRALNLDGPAPLAVVRRAMQDQRFAHYLLVARNSPEMRRVLLEDPRNQAYEAPLPEEHRHSTQALVARAAKAMARWGKAGFVRVDDETFAQRWGACQRCPNLVDPPKAAVYQAMRLVVNDQRICGACGCNAYRKAQVPTERCPQANPRNPAVNRWNQPMAVD